jgi:hypothetical protein
MLDKTSSIHQSKKGQHFSSRILAGRSVDKNSQPFDEPAISRPILDVWIFQVIFGKIFLIIRDGAMSSLVVGWQWFSCERSLTSSDCVKAVSEPFDAAQGERINTQFLMKPAVRGAESNRG